MATVQPSWIDQILANNIQHGLDPLVNEANRRLAEKEKFDSYRRQDQLLQQQSDNTQANQAAYLRNLFDNQTRTAQQHYELARSAKTADELEAAKRKAAKYGVTGLPPNATYEQIADATQRKVAQGYALVQQKIRNLTNDLDKENPIDKKAAESEIVKKLVSQPGLDSILTKIGDKDLITKASTGAISVEELRKAVLKNPNWLLPEWGSTTAARDLAFSKALDAARHDFATEAQGNPDFRKNKAAQSIMAQIASYTGLGKTYIADIDNPTYLKQAIEESFANPIGPVQSASDKEEKAVFPPGHQPVSAAPPTAPAVHPLLGGTAVNRVPSLEYSLPSRAPVTGLTFPNGFDAGALPQLGTPLTNPVDYFQNEFTR